jgi:hypothetical protein
VAVVVAAQRPSLVLLSLAVTVASMEQEAVAVAQASTVRPLARVETVLTASPWS